MFAIRCKHIVSGNSLRDLGYVTVYTALLVSVDDNSYLLCTFDYAYIRRKLNWEGHASSKVSVLKLLNVFW